MKTRARAQSCGAFKLADVLYSYRNLNAPLLSIQSSSRWRQNTESLKTSPVTWSNRECCTRCFRNPEEPDSHEQWLTASDPCCRYTVLYSRLGQLCPETAPIFSNGLVIRTNTTFLPGFFFLIASVPCIRLYERPSSHGAAGLPWQMVERFDPLPLWHPECCFVLSVLHCVNSARAYPGDRLGSNPEQMIQMIQLESRRHVDRYYYIQKTASYACKVSYRWGGENI